MQLVLTRSVARRIPVTTLLSIVSVGGFFLLLINDRISPLVVSLLQIYLSF